MVSKARMRPLFSATNMLPSRSNAITIGSIRPVCGKVRSTKPALAVLNDQLTCVIVLPVRSRADRAVTVYCWLPTRAALGVNFAVWVGAS